MAHWPAVAASISAVAVALVLQWLFRPDPLATVPVVGEGNKASRRKQFVSGQANALYSEGYKKFRDGLFRIATPRSTESIVISTKFVNELRNLPDDVLSFDKAVSETMQAKYTRLQTEVPALAHTVKASLTPALPRLNASVADEVVEAMRQELPQTSDWTEVNINYKLLRIVAMASGRVFIGSELCRDERYLDAAINYTVDLVAAVEVVSRMPVWSRPFLAPRCEPVKKVHARMQQADEFLRPIVAARRNAEAQASPDYVKPDDMLQWIMDSQKKFGEKNDEDLANYQLGVSFAAIHTTTMTTTNAIYTLAAMPELTPMLREDVQQALSASGGQFTSLAMQKMRKLDSFLREILRYYPIAATSFNRKVLKPFTLSNGQVIPAGVVIELPAGDVAFDEDLFPAPHVFDALRFYKMRQAKDQAGSGVKAAEAVANAQFVSVGASSLTFGYGRHACPGRFFAANEIKMIMATFLLDYEVRLPEGVTERYKNLEFSGQSVPDPTKTILIRKL
ncbi:cytochrome P450 [Sodiomyces alkalinus F11]|uniref:Cytochrome P450 n=1 Tax=Sodiomyces alkalinus (strain CBS 110278 / VKM F-3762 / F11) TaxID=1314773 RepID=A0A3N2Q8Q4_SODAK|nr:cytochrome P450 [Sodiomyces alkalinus F11]ROT43005.1 cytochrome P450 [Sodiomyces alkalinus F11]